MAKKVAAKAKAKTAGPKAKAAPKAAAHTVVENVQFTRDATTLNSQARWLEKGRTLEEKVARIKTLNFVGLSALDAGTLEVDGLTSNARLMRDVVEAEKKTQKLTTAHLAMIRRMYMTKKNGAGFLEVLDKALPVCPVVASALQVLTSSRYLTKKSAAPLKTYIRSCKTLNQRTIVWLLKAMLDVKPNSPRGADLWIHVMTFIKTRDLDTTYPEVKHILPYMDEALVKHYAMTKGAVGLAGFVSTNKKPLALVLDIDALQKVLSTRASGNWATIAPLVQTLMSTNIGCELVGFLQSRSVSEQFSVFIAERFKKFQNTKLTEALVDSVTQDCFTELQTLGYEDPSSHQPH